jgi:hypothetical protein
MSPHILPPLAQLALLVEGSKFMALTVRNATIDTALVAANPNHRRHETGAFSLA